MLAGFPSEFCRGDKGLKVLYKGGKGLRSTIDGNHINLYAVHALVHIKTHKKGSQYKHIRKGAFSSKNAPEMISDC